LKLQNEREGGRWQGHHDSTQNTKPNTQRQEQSLSTMSCFTFTAPLITPEEERLEKAALTDAERQQLHNEVFGGEQIVHETDKTLRNGTAILNQAISELPTAVKATYLEALERAPELVEKESNPHSFLRCENHDARAAANRLVNYWDVRKKTFGPDKAFLPMTQAGALADEMDYVRKALAVNLPNDEHGRAVILFDRIRSIAKNAPRDSIVRCFFYVVQAMSDNEEVQRRGFVLIINLRVSARRAFWRVRLLYLVSYTVPPSNNNHPSLLLFREWICINTLIVL